MDTIFHSTGFKQKRNESYVKIVVYKIMYEFNIKNDTYNKINKAEVK